MKNIILLILISVLLLSCEDSSDLLIQNTGIYYGNNELKIFTIDSCEYIGLVGLTLTHKGNCKNPIHNK